MDQRLDAHGLDLARDGFRLGAIAAHIDHDGRAALRQRQRDGAADVAAGAGDDGDLAAEFVVGIGFIGFRHPSAKATIQQRPACAPSIR